MLSKPTPALGMIALVVSQISFFLIVAWGETVGLVHAFRQHGSNDGWASVYVPPLAWWRGLEFFFHEKESDETVSSTLEEWPELTVGEFDIVSRIAGKAMREPLTDDDLEEYRNVLRAYLTRVDRPLEPRAAAQFRTLMETPHKYQYEFGRCLLRSIDGGEPFISPNLETLREAMRKQGRREGKLETDLRMLTSAAYRTTYEDEFGQQYHPISRVDVVEGLEESDRVLENMKRLATLFDNAANN